MTDLHAHADTPEPIRKEWVTDAELIRRSGVPREIMRRVLRAMDANPRSGFPRKDKLWGNKRHWPTVQAYWKEEQRRKMEASHTRRAS